MNKHTHEMLARLTRCLIDHAPAGTPMEGYGGTASHDAESLRRISMTLHRWHELECGDSNAYASWSIARGEKNPNGSFYYNDEGKPYIERHYYPQTVGQPGNRTTYSPIADREAGALKRLASIMARYPSLSYYVQTDPRGASLYILRPGDVPAGEKAESYYSRGVAVFK